MLEYYSPTPEKISHKLQHVSLSSVQTSFTEAGSWMFKKQTRSTTKKAPAAKISSIKKD